MDDIILSMKRAKLLFKNSPFFSFIVENNSVTEGASSMQEEIAHLLGQYPEIPYSFQSKS